MVPSLTEELLESQQTLTSQLCTEWRCYGSKSCFILHVTHISQPLVESVNNSSFYKPNKYKYSEGSGTY